MMDRHNGVEIAEEVHTNNIHTLLQDIVRVTGEMVTCAQQEHYDSIDELLKERGRSVDSLNTLVNHLKETSSSSAIHRDTEIVSVLTKVQSESKQVQSLLKEKSNDLLGVLHSIQQHRFYNQQK